MNIEAKNLVGFYMYSFSIKLVYLQISSFNVELDCFG